MALYPPSPAPPVAGSSKNEKLIFAPSPDTPLSSPAGQATIAARAAAHTAKVAAGVPTTGDSSGTSTPGRAGQFLQHEHRGGLRQRDLDAASPIAQFHAWFAEAKALGGIAHPETCTLSTARFPSGRVSARMVYLKELDHQGFVLYSNFGTSRKADDLASNPWASLTFWWEAQERQVRVEGRANRLSAAESQVYFDTRVRGSRIGAWASRQSATLVPKGEADPEDDGRAQLEEWVAEAEQRFGKGDAENEDNEDNDPPIPVPEFWGGLRIVPERVEFWQGRQNRLHDRFVYDRQVGSEADGTEAWTIKRLSP
ncbi:pyridoxamine 5'-phosphate oxidase [Sporothrix schenckii ATCC 58251]|uniref:pyridoxal 5'-phosphate synthase n=1 Tax=Sporothrix schenckii (strain ATCC 58251 / de Perez 2211183) TaxID=1391915 RepID=U7PMJ8_SPOS1|nr:pyridoxamine 5'-phosphate oxidase [Sporothrix schenckii ATCC 58251]